MIIIQLILHPQKNKPGTGDADAQSKNVQETIGLIFPKVPDSHFEIILEHGYYFKLLFLFANCSNSCHRPLRRTLVL
jgi:hypothetical protein